jgi:Flp pilus assembly protein TadD
VTLTHADHLLDLGRHEEALKALSSLGDEGGSARAHCLRARAYLGLGKPKEAADAATAAIVAAPEWEWGYRLAAIAASQRGRAKDARSFAGEAVRHAPGEPYAHQIAALTALRDSDKEIALQHAHKMVELAPNDPASHVTLGRCLVGVGRGAAAEAPLRKALELDPQEDQAMSLLADVVGARDKEQATELRLAALRAAPQDVHHRKNLLRRGGYAAGGALLLVGKVGLLGKLVAINVLRHLFSATTLLIGALTVGSIVFVVTRVRRHGLKRKLPPLVWEGLRAERRNADLLWLAWPAGFVLLGATLITLAQSANSQSLTALPYLAGSIAVLAMCWSLRLGDARSLTVRQVFGRVLSRFGRRSRASFRR